MKAAGGIENIIDMFGRRRIHLKMHYLALYNNSWLVLKS